MEKWISQDRLFKKPILALNKTVKVKMGGDFKLAVKMPKKIAKALGGSIVVYLGGKLCLTIQI